MPKIRLEISSGNGILQMHQWAERHQYGEGEIIRRDVERVSNKFCTTAWNCRLKWLEKIRAQPYASKAKALSKKNWLKIRELLGGGRKS